MRRAVVGVMALLFAPAPARAAWIICDDMLTGEAAVAKAEVAAKQMTLADWTAKARLLGAEYTRWQLAWNRRLVCEAVDSGQVRCVARGRPCRLSQTPPPPGSGVLKPADVE